jgi:putative nucleotidyltransferase with HDIG domain
VAQFDLTPKRWGVLWIQVRRTEVLARVAIGLVCALVMWIGTGAWNPPFPYREGMVPNRDVIASASFETVDAEMTREARQTAKRKIECVYTHDPQPLVALRTLLSDRIANILRAESYDALDMQVWHEFNPVSPQAPPSVPPNDRLPSDRLPNAEVGGESGGAATTGVPAVVGPREMESSVVVAAAEATADTPATGSAALSPEQDAVEPEVEEPKSADELVYEVFVTAFEDDRELEEFKASIARAFSELERTGLMEKIQHSLEISTETNIQVFVVPENRTLHHVPFADVTTKALEDFDARLRKELKSEVVEKLVVPWLKSRLPMTLNFDEKRTKLAAEEAAADVKDVMTKYEAGQDQLAVGGAPLTQRELSLLRLEYEAYLHDRPVTQILARMGGEFGLYVALYTLCGVYIYHRRQQLFKNWRRMTALQVVVVLVVLASYVASRAMWRAEMVPLVLCAMTLVIAYGQELAMLIVAAVSLVTVLSLGYGLFEFVVLTATVACSVLILNRVRNRTKLIYVGLGAALVAMLTTLGAGMVTGTPLGKSLIASAAWYGFFTVVAGVLMTGLLPFIEQWMDVQTDLSLLELGDVAHPLLQELVRRAPGTYNHSINVASLGEAAAEAIGANGLLVRVGAYFHDIGKMLKPQYFIENQSADGNCHEDLLPAMSTLIIIAHVKDGADLARQHHLPQCIVDFILQHHGTTLVEYFYDRASRQRKEDPDAGEVDEGSYRYPGPKPQTREAAVLMLADAVESASRTLQDPAPSRIENLVDKIAMKKLLDNQFDECGLTLQELRDVQDSLVKSLTGMYHSRVKYPNRNSA